MPIQNMPKYRKKGYMRGQLQDQLSKINEFARKNLYPPGY